MKDWFNLTKLLINESWGISQFLYNKNHDSKAFLKQLALIILVMIALAPSFLLYVSLLMALSAGLSHLGQASLFLSLGFIATSLVIVVFGIMQVLGEFYFSQNVEELLPLPVEPEKIILAKFGVVLVANYIFSFFAFGPVLLIYGIGQGMGIIYLFLAILVFLCLPIIPLALVSTIIMLVMRGSARGRKDVIQLIFSVVLIILIFVLQFAFSSQLSALEGLELQSFLTDFLQSNQSFLKIAYLMPTSILVSLALTRISLMSFVGMILLVLITGLTLMMFTLIGKKFYLSSLVSGQNSKKGKQLSAASQRKLFSRKNPAWFSVFLMDFKIITKTPIFLFNNVSVVIILPVILLLSLTFSGIEPEDLRQLQSFYRENPFLFTYLLIGFFAFFATSSATTATSFSREGKASWLTQIIPVSAASQIMGRTLTGILIQSCGMLFTLLAISYYLPLSAATVISAVILGLIASLPILLFGLLMDMNRPLLSWDNPQKAVKNNLNVIITLFVGTFYVGIIGGLSFLLGYFIADYLGYLSFIGLNALSGAILYYAIKQRLEQKLITFDD